MTYISWFDDVGAGDLGHVGGKGANLGELTRSGLPVPSGFIVTTRGYDAFVDDNGLRSEIEDLASVPEAADPVSFEDAASAIRQSFESGGIPDDVAAEIRAAYEELHDDGGTALAVRSSATAEDLPGASFAGQQETFLNVRDAESLLAAVEGCWASLWTARAMAYRKREGIDPADVSLAVVVQELVPAEAAGIMFTTDPSSGRRDRVVIDAAWGLGEAIVGGEVTPDNLVVEKESGRVLERETAEKVVMTVRTDDGTDTEPVPEEKRREPVLTDEQAATLAAYGVQIEEHYGAPQDVEWVLADGEFFIVQARPITVLPEPSVEPPTDWSVPDSVVYARGSIIELLPDPLTPLFADLSPDAVTWGFESVLNELAGEETAFGEVLGFTTVNGYAYYSIPLTLRAMWNLTVDAVPLLSSVGGEYIIQQWWDVFHPRYVERVERWESVSPTDRSAAELLSGVEELLRAGTEYYTSVQAILPSIYLSEAIFTAFYERFIRRAGDPPAHVFMLGFDSAPIRAEKSLYDVAQWCREHPELVDTLVTADPDDASVLLVAADAPAGHDVSSAVWAEWQRRFQAYLDDHGHTVYDLDFAKSVPADDPATPFRTLVQYLQNKGQDPHKRQREAVKRRNEATRVLLSRIDWPRRPVLRRLLRYAQHRAPLREDGLADVGLAWPVLRRLIRELGRRSVDLGVIREADDAFWLTHDELERVAAVLDSERPGPDLDSFGEVVDERKATWRARKRVTPPQVLPERSRFTAMERLFPASGESTDNAVHGTGASAGRVTATARVIDGPEDFERVEPGDVLVARITTPAWTPLFAVASAVVTDVGGPLSHSSIVAREYGIPAVLGTGDATKRIVDGETVTVDGDAGTVTMDRPEGSAQTDRTDGDAEAETEATPAAVTDAGEASSNADSTALVALAVGVAFSIWLWLRNRRSTER